MDASSHTQLWAAVAGELRAVQHRKQITTLRLVELTGIPERTLHRYLNGEREPKSLAFAVICEALGVSFADVITAARAATGEG